MDTRSWSLDEICAIFGVPGEIVRSGSAAYEYMDRSHVDIMTNMNNRNGTAQFTYGTVDIGTYRTTLPTIDLPDEIIGVRPWSVTIRGMLAPLPPFEVEDIDKIDLDGPTATIYLKDGTEHRYKTDRVSSDGCVVKVALRN